MDQAKPTRKLLDKVIKIIRLKLFGVG